MEEQQLEHALPSAPVGVELTHVWKGCKCMREKKRQQDPSTTHSPQGPLATSALPPCAHSKGGGMSLGRAAA